jgi:DNA-binding IclR family transcriptional regulator
MGGFDRYNNLLSLFTTDENSWTVVEIAARLQTPASSIYRNLRELVAAGFLESAAGSFYRLGPAFLEFERTIRMTDPLVRAGAVFLDKVIEQSPVPCVVVLARLSGGKVMCVADAQTPEFECGTSYQRGRAMPIDKGATSRAILAQLNSGRVKQVLDQAESSVNAQGLHADLAHIRKAGRSVTSGEVDAGLKGIAVPLHNKALGIVASLSCVFEAAGCPATREPEITALLMQFGEAIEVHMQNRFDALEKSHEDFRAK